MKPSSIAILAILVIIIMAGYFFLRPVKNEAQVKLFVPGSWRNNIGTGDPVLNPDLATGGKGPGTTDGKG